ncbi:MAG: hypothetical protein ACO3RU_12080 [Planctomycetota bacterium]
MAAHPHIVALPALRLACRPLDGDGQDEVFVMAEAAAMLAYGREHGRVSAPWLVLDGDRREVAVPVPAGIALEDGMHERAFVSGRWAALDAELATVAGIQAAASTLRAKAPEPLVGSEAPIYARITEDGATVHIGLTEEYRRG